MKERHTQEAWTRGKHAQWKGVKDVSFFLLADAYFSKISPAAPQRPLACSRKLLGGRRANLTEPKLPEKANQVPKRCCGQTTLTKYQCRLPELVRIVNYVQEGDGIVCCLCVLYLNQSYHYHNIIY